LLGNLSGGMGNPQSIAGYLLPPGDADITSGNQHVTNGEEADLHTSGLAAQQSQAGRGRGCQQPMLCAKQVKYITVAITSKVTTAPALTTFLQATNDKQLQCHQQRWCPHAATQWSKFSILVK
jgi:hypothetical protein